MSERPKYQINHLFDAPRDLVWRAWTTPELLAQWYGPGVETIIHRFDLVPGGLWLNEMKMGVHSDLSRIEFKEVVEEERLVWHHCSADADWNVIANPMMPDWPRTILTVVTFEEQDGQTKVRLTWIPHEASDVEIACFTQAMAGFGKGWGSGFKIMEGLLADIQAEA